MRQQSNDFWATVPPWVAVLAAVAVLSGLPFVALLTTANMFGILWQHLFPGADWVLAWMLLGPVIFVGGVGITLLWWMLKGRHRRPTGVGDGSGRGSSLPTTR